MNNSIFGASAPKFIFDPAGENEATILLDYWTTTLDEPEIREVVHESELQASRQIVPRGDFWIFEGRINLYKYGTLAEIRSKFEEIYQYNNSEVELYKHRDGEAYKDSSNNSVLFYLRVTPRNLTTLDYRDILMLTFRSLKSVDFSDSSATFPSLSEIIMSNSY